MNQRSRIDALIAVTARPWLAALMVVAAACAADPRPAGDDDDHPDAGGACGNHLCEQSETVMSCPQDCSCGNHVCDNGETAMTCAQDCTCGNHVCDNGETATTCPQDCNTCGNNVCDATESIASCPQDCHAPICGNNTCDPGETTTSCAHDCTAMLVTKNASSYTVFHLYVYQCGMTSEGPDWLGTHVLPSGGAFTLTNIPPGCWLFHATTQSGSGWRTPEGINLVGAETFTWTLTN